ncbi:hypothetical protein [Paenibacillus sp. 453mf]|uniref:hypothetical protein n=1 Tax=Paenibacillus sp. 453mf TaxID=1761874 RepID=UPI0008E1B16D|nr:hypothetical protein [Paenibacillus sp. 453mf]SFS76301.1 hypothetical protein SAMN04488601_10355 [Paenibacillus sp. 453mf]
MSFVAKEPFSGSGNAEIKFRVSAESLRIINTGFSELAFKLSSGFEYTMASGEVIDEQIDPNTVSISGMQINFDTLGQLYNAAQFKKTPESAALYLKMKAAVSNLRNK